MWQMVLSVAYDNVSLTGLVSIAATVVNRDDCISDRKKNHF